MNVTKNLIGAAVLVALAGVGCSTPAYQPLGEDVGASGGDVGYRSKLVSRDEMLVYYRGKQGMSLGDAVELAKVRAAELARAEGHDRFTVVDADREVEKEVDYVPAYGVGYGPGGVYGPTGSFGTLADYDGYSTGYVDVDRYPEVVLRVRLGDGPDALAVDEVLTAARLGNPHYPPTE